MAGISTLAEKERCRPFAELYFLTGLNEPLHMRTAIYEGYTGHILSSSSVATAESVLTIIGSSHSSS